MPRLRSSVRIVIQYLAPSLPSVGPTQIPNTSVPVQVDAHGHVDRPVGDLTITDLDDDGVNQDHRIDVASSGRYCQATRSSTMASVI